MACLLHATVVDYELGGATLHDVVDAAACSRPILPEDAVALKPGGGPGLGKLEVERAGGWVTVDGVEIGDETPLPAGWHLLQAGADGDDHAAVAEWMRIPADGDVVRYLVPHGVDGTMTLYGCGAVDEWLADVHEATGDVAAEPSLAVAALAPRMLACPDVTDEQRWAGWTGAMEIGARAGDPRIAAAGRAGAIDADAKRFDTYVAPSRRAARLESVGALAGLGLVAVAAPALVKDGDHDGAPFLASVAGTALLLGSTSAQHGALARQGIPSNGAAAGVGFGLLGADVLVPAFPEGGFPILATGAVTARVVQWVENGLAARKAHRERTSDAGSR